jgi:septal ring factor EnvC (AmiA/AmiB activator)
MLPNEQPMKQPLIFIFVIFVAGLYMASCTDTSTAEKAKKLDEQNKTLLSQIEAAQQQRQALEQTIAELRQQIRQIEDAAKQATERRSVEQWNAMIDQVLVKLDRVKNEHKAFSSARLVSEFTFEETRLKSIAREQEAQARSLVYELKAQKFPKAEILDQLVEEFISAYTNYISYNRVSWQLVKTFGKATDAIKKKESKYLVDYNDILSKIKALKEKA